MEYELRLYRTDGNLSIVMKIQASGNADARFQARYLLDGDIRRVSIWREDAWVDSLVRPLPQTDAPDLFDRIAPAAGADAGAPDPRDEEPVLLDDATRQ